MSQGDDEDGDDSALCPDDQLSLDELIKSADSPDGENLGTLSIEASCAPADIIYSWLVIRLGETLYTKTNMMETS